MALTIDNKVPDFTLPSTTGTDFTLSKDAKNKMCIIYVYPEDFSPLCTLEACTFRDTFDFFNELGVDVYGISSDTIETHLKFKQTYKLQFELLSDSKYIVARQLGIYGANQKFTGLIKFTKRVTFLLNKEHQVVSMFQSNFFPKDHIKTMVEAVKNIKY